MTSKCDLCPYNIIWGCISGGSATVTQNLGQGRVAAGMHGLNFLFCAWGKHCHSARLCLWLL